MTAPFRHRQLVHCLDAVAPIIEVERDVEAKHFPEMRRLLIEERDRKLARDKATPSTDIAGERM